LEFLAILFFIDFLPWSSTYMNKGFPCSSLLFLEGSTKQEERVFPPCSSLPLPKGRGFPFPLFEQGRSAKQEEREGQGVSGRKRSSLWWSEALKERRNEVRSSLELRSFAP
jgi:hypothetical protein